MLAPRRKPRASTECTATLRRNTNRAAVRAKTVRQRLIKVRATKTTGLWRVQGFARLRSMTLDELTAQLKAVLAGNPGEDLQKNLRATLAAGLSRMDVVSKQEFDVQLEMLNVLRTQIDALTAKVDALEKQQGAN